MTTPPGAVRSTDVTGAAPPAAINVPTVAADGRMPAAPAQPGSGERLVSVLVPAFNHERWVEECLDSVAASTHGRLELLVIDDGSSDMTGHIARRWVEAHRDRFERCEFRSRPNQGINSTLNELVSWSSGDYVCPVASDDRLLVDGIARRVEFLECRSDLDAIATDVELIDESGRVVAPSALRANGYRTRGLRSTRLLGVFLASWTAPFSHQFFRGSWSRANPYPADLGYEDFWCALTLSKDRRMAILPAATMQYRVPSGRTHGRMERGGLHQTHAASLEAALGDRRMRPSIGIARAWTRRTSAQPDGDVVGHLLHALLIGCAIRHRRLPALLGRAPS